jgi:AraC-like DNA-binding protein
MGKTDSTVHAFRFDVAADPAWSGTDPDLGRLLSQLLGNMTLDYVSWDEPTAFQLTVRAGIDTAVGAGTHDLVRHTWLVSDVTNQKQESLLAFVFEDSEITLLANGRRVVVPAGQLVIASSRVPVTMIQEGPCRWFVIRVAVSAVHLPVPMIEQVLFRPHELSGYLRQLFENVVPHEAADAEERPKIDIVGFDHYLAGLMEMMLRSIGENSADSAGGSRRQQVQRFILRNLDDSRLSVDTVASAHAVSRRRLYQLFAGTGIGVAEFIRQARIEKARTMLADPAYSGESVGRIAARVGITSPAHFSRLFRDAVGASPLEFRRAVNGRRESGGRVSSASAARSSRF